MQTSAGRFLLVSLLIGLLAGLLFLPGLPGNFVFDDFPNIVNNQAIQMAHLGADGLARAAFSPQPSGSLRTLPTLSFALDWWRAGGADAATFKTTNIFLHGLTAVALAWLFRSLLLAANVSAQTARWVAPALALAWAAHPLQVSSVLYSVQRIQTMATFFIVLALWAYTHARTAQIKGQPGRSGILMALLFWAMAMGCKEDSILLPAYTLALELTVLRFSAADRQTANTLRRSYLLASLTGAAIYLLFVVPHYWQADAYPNRDFSTLERLLTQARVLCMYLWQIVLPLPSHMPFYYDWLQPSRGLLHPWTTLPSMLMLLGLLMLAWHQRHRQPLFALGILWFFSAHFVASNVIGLELAFEHRNHFALAGAVLAIGSLLAQVADRLQLRSHTRLAVGAALIVGLSGATLVRAASWHDRLTHAHAITRAAPLSARGWIQLCAGEYETGGGAVKGNPRLDAAIDACKQGATAAPDSLNNFALLIVLKTLKGTVSQADWDVFQHQLETVHMSLDNCRAPQILSHNHREGVTVGKPGLLKALETMAQRCELKPFEAASIGYFVMNDLTEPDLAIPYFSKAIQAAPPGDPFPRQLATELQEIGRHDLAAEVEQLGKKKSQAPNKPTK